MKIAVMGAGNVGATIGRKFTEKGHEVFFGVREPEKHDADGLPGATDSFGEAASRSHVILLAVPFGAAREVLEQCGDIGGKIVIDATNPLEMGDKGLRLTMGFTVSGAEELAAAVPGAQLVKCFNQTGFSNMAEPQGSMMFACGDDPEATEIVRGLAEEIGFEAIAIGDLSKARLLEPLAMLWIHLAYSTDLKRDFAFGIQKR